MSDETWAFAPPPFDAAAGRLQLQRALRDLQLSERAGSAYSLQGRAVVEVGSAPGPKPPDAAGHPAGHGGGAPDGAPAPGASLEVRIVRRPALAPEWETRTLRSAADIRQFVDEVRRRLARWRDDD